MGTKIEQRGRDDFPLDEKQCDKQATHASVPIEKGVNCLKLGMRQSSVNQRGQGVVVQEPFPRVQACHEFRGRRRNIGRVFQRATRRPNPILAAPKLPRCSGISSHSPHQAFVEFAHEAQRNRQGLQSFQPILQRGDVVAHLLQIGRTSHRSRVGLGSQQFAEGRLSPLDAAG